MRVVLLSGGSGKRLWPLSNDVRSKAFLKLLPAPSEQGGKESMIQRVCRQLDSVGLLSSTVIVTHESQVEIMRNHIGEQIPIISEPVKRGTFSAIALAASYFYTLTSIDPQEAIVVLPVDLFAEASFFELICKIPEVLAKTQADLALIGATPKHPSSQLGYIVPQVTGQLNYWQVEQFVEKPKELEAMQLLKRGALWNCGVFGFTLAFLLPYLKKIGLPSLYQDLLTCYEQLPEASFDVEVVEKTKHSVVLPYAGEWKDLGSWQTLATHLEANVIGYGQITGASANTYLVNELPTKIHVIDIPDIIVAASPDGILVAHIASASQIKEQLSSVSQKPLVEEKRWGTCRILDHTWSDECSGNPLEEDVLTRLIELYPGKNTSYHQHQYRKEVWTILAGRGQVMLNEVLQEIGPGDVLQIPSGTRHAVRAITPLTLVEVQFGIRLAEDDITRLVINWEDSLHYRSGTV
ncbi:MAG: cupin domain-containing protein [Gorillibacterium sp.]|nr:cupin domain-containing protein [Gorillibacterium sp.]